MELLKLNLTIESPVCIAGNKSQELSPYTDYVLSNDSQEIMYIDQGKLEKTLGRPENLHLIDQYTEALLDVDNNRSRLQLKSFLNQHLPETDLAKLRIKNYGMDPRNRLPVTSVIKTGLQPYIPGSSLKGAVRTALLYDWLQNDAKGREELKDAYKMVKACRPIMEELNRLRVKRKRSRLDNYEFRKLRDVERQLRRNINGMLKEDQLFGKVNHRDFAPQSQFFQFSDSSRFEKEDIGVYNAARVRLEPLDTRFQRRSQIPQPREAILPGKHARFTVGIQSARLRNETFYKLKQAPQKQLLAIIRQFSQAALGLELYFLDEAEEMDRRYRKTLVDFYENLYQRSKAGETFLRIGMGKTYFDNSLGIALMNYAEDKHPNGENAFREFRKYALNIHPDRFFFPITRTISTNPVFPFGWIKISSEL